MKKKEKEECIKDLNKLKKEVNKSLSQEQKEQFITLRNRIKYSNNTLEVLDLLVKIAALLLGLHDLK